MVQVHFNAYFEDVLAVFGDPCPTEDDVDDLQTIAVWRGVGWIVYLDGNEYDPWELPVAGRGPDPYCVFTKDIDAFKDWVDSRGYHYMHATLEKK